MAISPISFAGTAAGETSFEQKLQKPQAYQAAEQQRLSHLN